MIFNQGARSRVPLYVDTFMDGVHKATIVIEKALAVLGDPSCRAFLDKVASRSLRNKPKRQRQFEIFVSKEFHKNASKTTNIAADIERHQVSLCDSPTMRQTCWSR